MINRTSVSHGQLPLNATGLKECKEHNEPSEELLVGSIRWREIPMEQFVGSNSDVISSNNASSCTQPLSLAASEDEIVSAQNDKHVGELITSNDQLIPHENPSDTDDQLDRCAWELGTLNRNNNIKDSLELLNEFSLTNSSVSSIKSVKDKDLDLIEKGSSGKRTKPHKVTEDNQIPKAHRSKSRTFKDGNRASNFPKKKTGAEQDRKPKASDFSDIDFDQLADSLEASALTNSGKARKI